MASGTGCGNNPCFLRVGEAQGLTTQGSCRCLDGIPVDQQQRILQTLLVFRQELRGAQNEAQQLGERLEKLMEEHTDG